MALLNKFKQQEKNVLEFRLSILRKLKEQTLFQYFRLSARKNLLKEYLRNLIPNFARQQNRSSNVIAEAAIAGNGRA